MKSNSGSSVVFGVIPAKGSSSGLPSKNMRKMAGSPMIYHMLKSAQGAALLDQCWVSTENDEIQLFCTQQGARVLRHDPSLSSDNSPTFGVIENIVQHWERCGEQPDIVVTMRATSPLCISEDIDQAIALLIESVAESVVAVTQSDVHPYRILTIDSDGFLQHIDPMSPEKKFPIRRQELSPVYIRTGAIYVTRFEVITQGSLWGTKSLPYIMPKERSVNVNDEIDFFLAEQLLLKRF